MDKILSFFSSDPNAFATILSAFVGAMASIIVAILRARPQTIDELFGVIRVTITLITKVLLVSIAIIGTYLFATHAIAFYQSKPKILSLIPEVSSPAPTPIPTLSHSTSQTIVTKPTPKPTIIPVRKDEITREEIVNFVDRYIALSNRGNVTNLLELYADKVTYFDKGSVSKSIISQDKNSYYKRWPEVVNTMEGDVSITDVSETDTKQVTFYLSFYVHSSKRNQTISGNAKNTLKISRIDAELKIVSENQEVLKKKIN